MTTTPAPIDLRKSRGFGEQINVTFAFIRENYKKLGKCVLYICGPPSALAGILFGGNWAFALTGLGELESGGLAASYGWVGLGLFGGMLIGLLATILMISVVNNYVFLYMERGYDGFEFEDVWEAAKGGLGKVFVTIFSISLVALAIYLLWIGLVMALGAFGAVLIFLLFPVFLYFVVALNPLFTVRLYENAGIGESISRSMELVKGNWWLTAGVLFIIYMVASFFTTILLMPAYILMMVSALNAADSGGDISQFGEYSLVITIFMTLYMVASYLISSVPLLASTLQYFNLVEKHEGVGMIDRIEQLGRDDEPGGLDTRGF